MITPHVRELRGKALTYGRVIGNWAVYAPSPAQLQAMIECIAELQAKVAEAKRDADGSKVVRRRSGTEVGNRGGGKALPSAIPPSMGWSASDPDASEVRSRRASQPQPTKQPSANEAITQPPPALSGSPPAPTIPPSSAPRALEEYPTPIPALLRSRRSH
jgi:hypothetical protein